MKKFRNLHSRHLWMLAICFGVPILGFLFIGNFNIGSPSLETLIFLACPIGMGIMMFLMNKNRSEMNSSHDQDRGEQGKQLFNHHSSGNRHISIFGHQGRFLGKTGTPFKRRKSIRIK